MTPCDLLDVLWRGYVAMTPQAECVRYLLIARGESLTVDHLALCTYAVPEIGIAALARPFEDRGWRARDGHERAGLRARYWQHDDAALPKVLISELLIDELSTDARRVIDGLVAQLPEGFGARGDLPWAGRPWCPSLADYRALAAESPYAAWVAAFGLCVNHFTIDVGALSTFPDLAAIDAFLVEHGFLVDERGGAIKGSRAERIEHSATVPDRISVAFTDATVRIPGCPLAMVRRYPLPSGELFHGLAAANGPSLVGTA